MTRSIPASVRAKTIKLAIENPHAARRYLGEALSLKRSQRNEMFRRIVASVPAPKEVKSPNLKLRKLRRLFLDIETSPNTVLSWRVGYDINLDYSNLIKERAIVCVCWKWEGESKIHSVQWDKNQCDKALLIELMEVLEEADEIVGHNLAKFDFKWLKTRALYHGLPPLPEIKIVDTLQIARAKFLFNSNKLDYLGKFLGLGCKIKTEFGLWKQVVLDNCQKALKKMVVYCCQDVNLLEQVFKKLQHAAKPKSHVGVMGGGERWSCPHDGSTNVHAQRQRISAAGLTSRQMKCLDCGSYYTISDSAHDEYTASSKQLRNLKSASSLSWGKSR